MNRIWVICLSVFLLTQPAVSGDEGEGSGADLISDFVDVPIGFFDSQAEKVADVKEDLVRAKLAMPSGSSAYFKESVNLLFIKSTRKDVNRIRRIFEDFGMVDWYEGVQIRLNARCLRYEMGEDWQKFAKGFSPTPASLASLPPDRVTLVHAISVTTKPGQTAKTSNNDGGDGGERPVDTPRATFEVQPVVGADKYTIDLALAYDLFGKLDAGESLERLNVISNVVINNGESIVMELGTLVEGKPRLFLLSLKADLVNNKGELIQTRRADPAPDFNNRFFPRRRGGLVDPF